MPEPSVHRAGSRSPHCLSGSRHDKSQTLTCGFCVFCGYLSTLHPDVMMDPARSLPRAHSHPSPLCGPACWHRRKMLTRQAGKLYRSRAWKLSREREGLISLTINPQLIGRNGREISCSGKRDKGIIKDRMILLKITDNKLILLS